LIKFGQISKAAFCFFAYFEKQLKLGLKINLDGSVLPGAMKILLK
jgi:hypothetical protein